MDAYTYMKIVVATSVILFGCSWLEPVSYAEIQSTVRQPIFSLAVDPVTLVGNASPIQRGSVMVQGEYFIAPTSALAVEYSRTRLNMGTFLASMKATPNSTSDQDKARVSLFDSMSIDKVTIGYRRYLGEDSSWYWAVQAFVDQYRMAANVGDADGKTRSDSFGPEVGGGYRWQFRHGSFFSLGANTVYRKQWTKQTTWSEPVALNLTKEDQQISKLLTAERYGFDMSFSLCLGYLFR